MISDLFKRYKMPSLRFKRKSNKAGAATPIYQLMSAREMKIANAVAEVRLIEGEPGMDRGKAIAKVSKRREVQATVIEGVLAKGQRSRKKTGKQTGERAKPKA